MSAFGTRAFGTGPWGIGGDTAPEVFFAEVLSVAGAPQVGVTLAGLSGPVTTVTVETSWDGGSSWHAVRGGGPLVISGGVFVRDYFPALARPIIYRALIDGEEPRESAPITVASDYWWLQDPLAPRSAVRLVTMDFPDEEGVSLLLMGAVASANLSQESETLSILGARLPVVSVGVRQAATGIPFKVAHEIALEGGALLRLLESSGQLVIRSTDYSHLDPVAHIAMPDLTITHSRPGPEQIATFEGVMLQTRPVSLQIVIPFFSYDQVSALGWGEMTYAEAMAARPGDTYLDWQRDPEEGA